MKAIVIFATIGFIIIALIVGISIFSYRQMLGFFRDPLWVSVCVTAILVGINAYYAWQVSKTIDEMKKARMAEFMPHVRADLSFFGIIPVIKITNFGKGPAINVKTKIIFSGGETKPWEQTIMSPNESVHLILPGETMDEILQRAAQIMVSGEYGDIFGKTYTIYDRMNTKEFIEQTQKLPPILEENLSMLIKEIGNELRDIKNELGYIRRELENSAKFTAKKSR
jgi:hypothetical protein